MTIPESNDKRYTLEQVRAAFWGEFHKGGERWFDYLGSEADAEQSTQSAWESFVEHLEASHERHT